MDPSGWSSVCVACGAPRERGVLCAACARSLIDDEQRGELCAEQFISRARGPQPGMENAWLVDGFGFPHTVSVPTTAPAHLRTVQLGRGAGCDVQVCDPTVSHTHALLERDDDAFPDAPGPDDTPPGDVLQRRRHRPQHEGRGKAHAHDAPASQQSGKAFDDDDDIGELGHVGP